MRSLLAFALSAATLASAALSVRDSKLQVVDHVSHSLLHSEPFSRDFHRALASTDQLKVHFTVARDDKPLQPQQAAVLVENRQPEPEPAGRRAVQLPVKVRAASGKAKRDIDLRTLAYLASPEHPDLDLSLLVGHPNEQPLRLSLGSVSVPPSALAPTAAAEETLPKHWEAEKYRPQPEIHWTFRGGEKQVNVVVALAGLAAVPRLLPLPSSASAASGPTSSTPTLPQLLFLSSLLALELLSILSWYRFLPVLHTLPYYLALAAVAVASGRAALGGMARRRKGQEVVEGKKQL
ncbi:hypothetical protein JCM8202_003760 [Rhodotorula sphaerocarpa]